jgi:hypothetical protein
MPVFKGVGFGIIIESDHSSQAFPMSYPIGAIMLMEVSEESRFFPRPFEGVKLPSNVSPRLSTRRPTNINITLLLSLIKNL